MDRLRWIIFAVCVTVCMSAIISMRKPHGWFETALKAMETEIVEVTLSEGSCLEQNYYVFPFNYMQQFAEKALDGSRMQYKIVGFENNYAYKLSYNKNQTTFITEKTRLNDYVVVACK